jgi:glycosyltransferase involved in cell wall biosynthesis
MSRPVRILHVFGRMGRGGAETWIMNVLRHDPAWRVRFQLDFLVHETRAGELDEEIRDLGGRIIVAPFPRHPVRYPAALRAALRAAPSVSSAFGGPYDIVHSHVGFFSGWVLALAAGLGVRGRIAHSHNDFSRERPSPGRALYQRAMRASLHASATRGLGCSAPACASLFGADWQARDKYEVLLYGYDFDRLAGIDADLRAATRRSLGLGERDFVIGHIGHFQRQKNHDFIVELAAASRARGRDHRFVLVGEGALRPEVEQAIAGRGLGDRFVLTGLRSDIPALLSTFDLMILPSRWEGLGIVVLEAQAAGVPCLLSDRVPAEATVIEPLIARRALDVHAWLDAVDEIAGEIAGQGAGPVAAGPGAAGPGAAGPRPSRAACLAAMRASRFSIARNVDRMAEIYQREATRGRALARRGPRADQ